MSLGLYVERHQVRELSQARTGMKTVAPGALQASGRYLRRGNECAPRLAEATHQVCCEIFLVASSPEERTIVVKQPPQVHAVAHTLIVKRER